MSGDFKTCSKCGERKESTEFRAQRNACKDCERLARRLSHEKNKEKEREERKERYQRDAEKEKLRSKQYYKQNAETIKQNFKVYYDENAEELRQKRKEKYTENAEKERQQRKDYYNNNKAQELQYCSQYRKEHTESIKKYKKQYRKQHAEEIRLKNNQYLNTPKGKELVHTRNAKRRKLGFNPLNTWFEGCNYHHLRHKKETGEIDNDVGIHIPETLHTSVWHNGNTGYNMELINLLALKWYLDNTPKDKVKSIAISLYNYYENLQ